MTAQVHETLILNGEKTSMAFTPHFPEDHPRIHTGIPEDGQVSGVIFSTACWRQYIGTWEVKDGHFYLTKIEGRFQLLGNEPLLADWFTGTLRIPRGKVLHYVHMGFGSVFEEEIHIRIESGRVISERVIDNRGKPIDHWELTWRNFPGGENRFPGDEDPD